MVSTFAKISPTSHHSIVNYQVVYHLPEAERLKLLFESCSKSPLINITIPQRGICRFFTDWFFTARFFTATSQ